MFVSSEKIEPKQPRHITKNLRVITNSTHDSFHLITSNTSKMAHIFIFTCKVNILYAYITKKIFDIYLYANHKNAFK